MIVGGRLTHPGAGCKAVVHFFFASFRGGPRPVSLKICRGHNIRSEQMRLAVGLTSRETVVFFSMDFICPCFQLTLVSTQIRNVSKF